MYYKHYSKTKWSFFTDNMFYRISGVFRPVTAAIPKRNTKYCIIIIWRGVHVSKKKKKTERYFGDSYGHLHRPLVTTLYIIQHNIIIICSVVAVVYIIIITIMYLWVVTDDGPRGGWRANRGRPPNEWMNWHSSS